MILKAAMEAKKEASRLKPERLFLPICMLSGADGRVTSAGIGDHDSPDNERKADTNDGSSIYATAHTFFCAALHQRNAGKRSPPHGGGVGNGGTGRNHQYTGSQGGKFPRKHYRLLDTKQNCRDAPVPERRSADAAKLSITVYILII